ncbi:MAG TPA: hypothetical protein VGW78_03220 [Candidatus Babeliales bacterium]|jgi:hypothetical protein|nr:hypothetical protein [Candidatus Babeliales bacterium]
MKHTYKKIISLLWLCSGGIVLADNCCTTSCNTNCENAPMHVTTCYLPRSQSRDTVIKNAGLDPYHQHRWDADGCYYTLNIGVEYTHSFKGADIARCLFGPAAICTPSISSISSIGCNSCNNDDCNNDCTTNCSTDCNTSCDNSCDSVAIRIVGSLENPNGTTDLIADNFMLPRDFSSVVTFSPKISNINVPIHFYAGLDKWCTNTYVRIYAPVTHTKWELNACETITHPGTIGFNIGDIAPVAVGVDNLYSSFLSYTSGDTITLPTTTPQVTVQPLRHQRILPRCDEQTKTALADLRAELGWYWLLDECYHLAINIQGAAPTGNECSECFLFGPIVGNGKHWELGGGLNAHYTFWTSEDDEKQLGFYIDADVTHLFKHSEDRVFDLKNKPLSRYIFVEKMTKADPLLQAGTPPGDLNLQFANVFAPLANVAVQSVDVSFDVQGDVLAKFVYTCHGFNWEIGYNFWGRSCQRIDLSCDCDQTNFEENVWALRDGAAVFGFEEETGTPRDIPATVNSTTVFSIPSVSGDNFGVDHTVGNVTFNGTPLATTPTGFTTIFASNSAVTIQTNDLDMDPGERAISHKVFTHFNYTWLDCDNWTPYVGFGASGEWGSTTESGNNETLSSTSSTSSTLLTPPCDQPECDRCPSCALSQWAVWVKGGISF